jgi:hypothetical protein
MDSTMLIFYGIKLAIRIALFVAAVLFHVSDKNSLIISGGLTFNGGIKPVHFIWFILAVEMIQKFFPNQPASMGCRKQFEISYRPGRGEPSQAEIASRIRSENAAAKEVVALWLGGNAVVGLLYWEKVLGESDLVLLCLFYSVCDLVCVLFYCPFQSLVMKNRCCVTCRIFNWDSLMRVTPLIFIPCPFSWSLLLIAVSSFACWEITYHRFPRRFIEESNASLQCAYCEEKLCRLKRTVGARGGPAGLNLGDWQAGNDSKHIQNGPG